MANADSDLQLLSVAERGRQLQKLKKRRLQGREDEVCLQYLFDLIPIFFLFGRGKFILFEIMLQCDQEFFT